MNKIAFAFALLIVISAGFSISADDIFTELIDVNQDITQSEMTYEFCNPFESNEMYPDKIISNHIYVEFGAENIPEIDDDVSYFINYSKPNYIPSINRTQVTNQEDNEFIISKPYYINEVVKNITGYTEGFRMIEKTDSVKAGECIKIKQIISGVPRYKDFDKIDIVPVANLKALNPLLETKITIDKEIVEQKKWAWWNISFLNRSTINVVNPESQSYSALPMLFNVTLQDADADGTDIKVVCSDSIVEHAVMPYGSQLFGIKFFIALTPYQSNSDCELYYNPTAPVDNTSADWKTMSFNLWFNVTEHYFDWEDFLDNTDGWYLTTPTGRDAPDGYALYSTTHTAPYPIFKDIIVPNSADLFIQSQINNSQKKAGLVFAENNPSLSPYTAYSVEYYGQLPNRDYVQLVRYTNGVDSILASNSTLTIPEYFRWMITEIQWRTNGDINTNSFFMNRSLYHAVNFNDINYVQGYLGIYEDVETTVSHVAYRQVGNYTLTITTNESISPPTPTNATVGNVTGVDIDWGEPTNQYCLNPLQLKQDWALTINTKVYIKSKIILCEYGCSNAKCKISDEQEALNEFWKYGIFILFFIAVILVYLYIKR